MRRTPHGAASVESQIHGSRRVYGSRTGCFRHRLESGRIDFYAGLGTAVQQLFRVPRRGRTGAFVQRRDHRQAVLRPSCRSGALCAGTHARVPHIDRPVVSRVPGIPGAPAPASGILADVYVRLRASVLSVTGRRRYQQVHPAKIYKPEYFHSRRYAAPVAGRVRRTGMVARCGIVVFCGSPPDVGPHHEESHFGERAGAPDGIQRIYHQRPEISPGGDDVYSAAGLFRGSRFRYAEPGPGGTRIYAHRPRFGTPGIVS
jgi:hypothetical protein